tara:strand:+ start:491 stop:1279 length:789 start_codon:yes stop_codon:yes gene_type:complete
LIIPIKELLKGSKNKKELESLFKAAELAFKSWNTIYTNFVSAPLREEVFKKLELFDDIYCESHGGYVEAERQRISFSRKIEGVNHKKNFAPVNAINIEGNFLFDRADKIDFINGLKAIGASSESLGDLWLIRDRGAQVICTPETSVELDGKQGLVRGVEIKCELIDIQQLYLPSQRVAKKINSVEASTRIDAIASAGFGMSRSKIILNIKEGKLRKNWEKIKQSNKSVSIGDKIQLEGKGSIEIINIEITKRERWRVELIRK